MREHETLRNLVVRAVSIARKHGADSADLAELLGSDDTVAMLTDEGVATELERFLVGQESVMVSREWIAEKMQITPQGVSHLCRVGHLSSRKIRVDGRLRIAVPLSSVCEYFGISDSTREQSLTAHLSRDEHGDINPTFLMASSEQC